MTKMDRARILATEAHAGQWRKYNRAPYIVHPHQVHEEVMAWATKAGISEEDQNIMGQAAWLHDVLEDCPQITKERIIQETDEATFNLMLELTNPSKGSKANRAARKQMDRDHLAHVSRWAKIIKMIDRRVNLGDLGTCPDRDFVALYARESRALLECLKDADTELAQTLLAQIEALEAL